MKFIKFHTNVFYGQLQHVPEPCQILRGGPWMSIGILCKRKKNSHALEAMFVTSPGSTRHFQILQITKGGWVPFSFQIGEKSEVTDGALLCLVAQSCPTLCDTMDCSLPGSSVHGTPQAIILEWVAMPSSLMVLLFIYFIFYRYMYICFMGLPRWH